MPLGTDLGTRWENGKASGTKSRTERGERGRRGEKERERNISREGQRKRERGKESQTDIRCRIGDGSSAMLWPELLQWEEKAEGTGMPSRVLSIKLLSASSQHYLLLGTLSFTRAQQRFISPRLLPAGSQPDCEYPPHFYSFPAIPCGQFVCLLLTVALSPFSSFFNGEICLR